MASNKRLQKRGCQGKLARRVVEKDSDDSDDDLFVIVGSFTQDELDKENNRRAQSIASKSKHKLLSANGAKIQEKKLTKSQKKRKKAAAAAAKGESAPWRGDSSKSKLDHFIEETISGHIGVDTFAGDRNNIEDRSTKRVAHDKLV